MTYLPHDQWSQPEDGDPPPCFRQGDLIQVTWVRPDTTPADGGRAVRMTLERLNLFLAASRRSASMPPAYQVRRELVAAGANLVLGVEDVHPGLALPLLGLGDLFL